MTAQRRTHKHARIASDEGCCHQLIRTRWLKITWTKTIQATNRNGNQFPLNFRLLQLDRNEQRNDKWTFSSVRTKPRRLTKFKTTRFDNHDNLIFSQSLLTNFSATRFYLLLSRNVSKREYKWTQSAKQLRKVSVKRVNLNVTFLLKGNKLRSVFISRSSTLIRKTNSVKKIPLRDVRACKLLLCNGTPLSQRGDMHTLTWITLTWIRFARLTVYKYCRHTVKYVTPVRIRVPLTGAFNFHGIDKAANYKFKSPARVSNTSEFFSRQSTCKTSHDSYKPSRAVYSDENKFSIAITRQNRKKKIYT